MTDTSFGQYQLLRLLGRGGMGEVYAAEHRVLQRQYALKLLPQDFATRPEAVRRFEREAKVMANLDHPHIVRVDEFGETDGRYWLRMELVKGVTPEVITLGDYAAQRGGKIDPAEFSGLLHQILAAVAYAHKQGVVHRDLKPGNILLEKDATGQLRAKVSDFGLARVIGEEFIRSQAQISVSRSIGQAETVVALGNAGASTRALLGTWEYMSPEQRRGEDADARSDVYAIGLMCYRLLTGEELGRKAISQIVPALGPAWDAFVDKAIDQKAAARYAHGGEMLAAFEALDLASPKSEGRSPKEIRGSKSTARTGTRRALVAALVAIVAITVAGLIVRGRRQPAARGSGDPKPVVQVAAPNLPGKPAIDESAAKRLAEEEQRKTQVAADKLAEVQRQQKAAAEKAEADRQAEAKAQAEREAKTTYPALDRPYENTLGMKFVPVPGTKVLFGIWDVRVQDYEKYAQAKSGVNEAWKEPGFDQGPTHPVVNVSWEDAQAFCQWLTEKERGEGKLTSDQTYRLPTDAEWSVAVGLDEPADGTPRSKSGQIKDVYPWGKQWPPPEGVGNYDSSLKVDNYKYTSPVGSLAANRFGLYDLGGNVWQWCEDWYDADHRIRVLRGASWNCGDSAFLLSSCRVLYSPGGNGFRCVLGEVSSR